MSVKRGRPRDLDKCQKINTCILSFKDDIVCGDSVASKSNNVWQTLSAQTGLSASALYSRVICNRYGIRDELFGLSDEKHEDDHPIDDTIDSVNSSCPDRSNNLLICFGPDEFNQMTERNTYSSKDARRRNKKREVLHFKPGVWEVAVNDRLYAMYKISCGFHFRKHHLSSERGAGSFSGYCKCGSEIEGIISDIGKSTVNVSCLITRGTGKCGKRYCRAPEREDKYHLNFF